MDCCKCGRKEERKCIDCSLSYCHTCFIVEHPDTRKAHSSRDPRTLAYFKDSYCKDADFCNDIELSTMEHLFPITDDSIDQSNEENTFVSLYTSLNIQRLPLFETNIINDYDSLANIAKVLEIETDSKLNIITFIGKPSCSNQPLVNELLMKDSPYIFPKCSESSLLCRVSCDSTGKYLILQTENMYKSIEGKTSDQDNLLRLLIILSDIIIFTQTTPDKPSDYAKSTRRDYIRIHDIMSLCKREFQVHYLKINKKEPEKLAPGLIYLVQSEFNFNESLPESIVDLTGRSPLYQSFSKILRYDGNDDEMFQYGLKQMLQDLSLYRMIHSLEEIATCIRNFKQSIINDDSDCFAKIISNEWFLCRQSCGICRVVCTKYFGHPNAHDNQSSCNETEENKVYFCKRCVKENSPSQLFPLAFKAKGKDESFFKSAILYTIRGKVIECEKHGIINDNNWLYNSYEDTVISKCIHKWPGSNLISQNSYPMSQMFIDKVSEISKPIHKVLSDSANTIADKYIIPDTWDKTSSAIECHCCQRPFTVSMSKHHCRNCGVVVCTWCFVNKQSQALCALCAKSETLQSLNDDPKGLQIVNFVKSPISAVSNLVRKTVTSINRPDYWEDDNVAIHCFICHQEFNYEMKPIHHCRACGKCVCDECSPKTRTVEWRYIHEPSRICNSCVENEFWKNGP